MIKFTCECGEDYNLADDAAGKTYRCRKCSKPFTVTTTQQRAVQAPKKAWDAVKILFSDPMSGQGRAAQAMGEAGCVEAGLVLCGAFAIAGYLAFEAAGAMIPVPGFGLGRPGFKALLNAAVPPAALIVGFFFIGKLFGGKASINKSVLVSGMTLLPVTLLLLLVRLVSFGNGEIIGCAAVFAVCFAFLLLYAASVEIHELSTRKAFFMVPILILATGYVAKVVLVQLAS